MRFRKFLRDNSRTLLMIFMSLLLVAFLIPNTIQNMADRERQLSRKLGRAFGREITDNDLEQARSDLRVLTNAGFERFSEGATFGYYLLMQEAERAGVRVGRDEVKAFLVERGRQDPLWQQPDETLKAIQRATRRSYDQVYDAVGRWLAVRRLRDLQADGLLNTLPREELAYRDRTQEASAQVSLIDDKAFLAQVPEPTEEQLQAFFDECKGRKTAHTDRELVFGYLLPDRVQIQYLTVDPQKIKGQITIQATQVRRFFEENAQRYMKPDPLATQPVAGQVPQVPMTFEEARDRAREDYREARATELAQSLVNELYREAHRPWGSSPRDADGFLETPPGELGSFQDLKQKLSTTYEVTYAETGLMDADQLKTATGIGGAGQQIGRQVLRLPELAMRIKGILPKDPGDGKPVLSVMEPAVVLTYILDPKTRQWSPRQAYLFRVADARPSAPPEDMGIRREETIGDWKLVQAHELARQRAEALAARALQVGLPAAVEQDTELKQMLTEADQSTSRPVVTLPPEPTRYAQDLEPFVPQNRLTRSVTFLQSRLETVKDIPEIPRAIFDLAETPVDEAAPHWAAAFPIAKQYRWLVAELLEVKPLYEGPFEKQLAASVQDERLRAQEVESFARQWGSAENVEQRTGFVPDRPPGQQPAPGGESE